METANWEKLENIFHAALERPFGERKKYLVQECGENKGLFSEVEALIDSFEKESYFLEESVLELGFSAIHETTKDKLKNKQIGAYRIEEKIGEGGMGEVYKAIDTRLNRRVALKFLSESLENDKTARRQLMREAQASAALDHPNICAVHGFEEIEGHSFIVMQFIEGKTLNEALKDRELSVAEFKSIAGQIVSAVAFAHSHNIIHRDLKPGNIMLTSDGQIKILDFGLAKVLQKTSGLTTESVGNSHFSQNGLVIGTVAYMSPEQLRGERIDYRSDIFSLGIIFYEILTKENPFKRNSQAETIAALLSEEQSKTIALNPKLPTLLDTFVEKCLQKNAVKRFQSAAEMLVAFDNEEIRTLKQISSKRKTPNILAILIGFILMILLFTGVFYYFKDNKPRTLAILPITFDNTNIEKEYLAVGFTQSIVDQLSDISDLKIINLSANESLKSKIATDPEAGKDINADAVFTGSIQQRGNNLVMVTKIFRTSDYYLIDSEELQIDETNLTSLQQYLSGRINLKIRTQLSEVERLKLAKNDTDNIEAKKLYFKGRHFLSRKKQDDVQNAIDVFSKAVDIDPTFTKAWTGLADAYLSTSLPGTNNAIAPTEAVKKAKSALNKAQELDPSLSEIYTSRGIIDWKYEWKWKEAEENFRKAISLKPNLVQPRVGLISVLNIQERFDEALDEAAKLKEIDNLFGSSDLEIAKIYYRKREYDKIDLIINDLMQKFPENRYYYFQCYKYLKIGKYNEVVDILEKIYLSKPEAEKVLVSAPLGFALARLNRRDEALKIINNLDDFAKNNYVPSQEKAIIYIGLGNFEMAFENLRKSCDEKFSSLPSLLSDPIIDDIKGDSRFSNIKKCVNLSS